MIAHMGYDYGTDCGSSTGIVTIHRDSTAHIGICGTVIYIDDYCAPVFRPVRMPPNWRWYHAFQKQPAEAVLPESEHVLTTIRRLQEKYPAIQRARQKRRRYVQALRGAS